MPVRAAFFDMGDTLVTTPRLSEDPWRPLVLDAIEGEFGRVPWAEQLYAADIRRPPVDDPYRQETNKWLAKWLEDRAVAFSPADIEKLRITFARPLPPSFVLAPGATGALQWCKERGMTVIVLTNTLSRGDTEAQADFARFGVAELIDDVYTSCTTGWEKPHPALFRRALVRASVLAADSFMVGDRLDLDVAGAMPLGIRAVWLNHGATAATAADPKPDAIIRSLEELPEVLGRWL
jgi:FMN phosphatase YigB (HAD superfamily)